MEPKSVREFAIDFETKGVNLYISLASKTQNILSKRLFYTLAEQEVKHASLFDMVYAPSNFLPETEIIQDVEAVMKEFWEKASKVELKKEPGDLSGYSLAMEMEEKSIQAYQEFLHNSNDDKEKKYLLMVIEEEKKHLDALRNVYYFFTQTGDWFQQEEGKIWNWMNQ